MDINCNQLSYRCLESPIMNLFAVWFDAALSRPLSQEGSWRDMILKNSLSSTQKPSNVQLAQNHSGSYSHNCRRDTSPPRASASPCVARPQRWTSSSAKRTLVRTGVQSSFKAEGGPASRISTSMCRTRLPASSEWWLSWLTRRKR